MVTGDEVLEWNGCSLFGKTFEEVYDIISESRHEAQVELIVSRHMTDNSRHHPARRHTHAGLASRGTSLILKIGRGPSCMFPIALKIK